MGIFKSATLSGYGKKHSGKVRDFFIKNNTRIIIATDRISAFDRVLGYVPYKGQVLNQLSAFWFNKTADIIQNHVLAVVDPNVTVAYNAAAFPLEIVVRGYITGVTTTSLWSLYEKGERKMYGLRFSNGLKKNQKLPKPVVTPTTKAEAGHDERLTRSQIIQKKIVPESLYRKLEKISLELFNRGSDICEKAGIILVDTKYEFGLYNGTLMLIDEIHTPDSSRFWIKKTYNALYKKGLEPENFDKEILRLSYKKMGYNGDGTPPVLPKKLSMQLSKRYRDIFYLLTKSDFHPASAPVNRRIAKNVRAYFRDNER